MKQLEIINQLTDVFKQTKGIKVALLIGSFARGKATQKSDIDYSLWIDKQEFDANDFSKKINEILPHIFKILKVKLRNKIVVYFENTPKIEFNWYENLHEIDKNFLGSEIEDITKSIVFQQNNLDVNMYEYLQKITTEKKLNLKQNGVGSIVRELSDKFLYEFESASNAHKRSDAYQFYFFYNIALDVAVKLDYLKSGKVEHYYLPKYFGGNLFKHLGGTLDLKLANRKKRDLLEFFYIAINDLKIHSSVEIQEMKTFLETIYQRDYLWNFRDVSSYNSKLKQGIIYRTATLTLYQEEEILDTLLKEKHIKTVIDLRADRERSEPHLMYNEKSRSKFKYVQAPFNPWEQSDYFKKNFHYGTDIQIAYRFFAVECKSFIKKAIEAILSEEESVAIHCFAGKDRTGVFISLLHLLSGADNEIVYTDYLASEVDTSKDKLDAFLEIVEKEGGIIPYLKTCELTDEQIRNLKSKITINE